MNLQRALKLKRVKNEGISDFEVWTSEKWWYNGLLAQMSEEWSNKRFSSLNKLNEAKMVSMFKLVKMKF